jgi:signal transduction histidine kinase
VLVATACLLPLLGVVLFVLDQSADHGRAQLLDTQGTAAEVVAQVLDATLEDNEQVLGELANTDKIRRLNPTDAGEVLEQFKRARPALYGLFLVNANGEPVAKAGLDPALVRLAPSFTSAVDRALKLGELGVSSKLTAPDAAVIAIVAPVLSKDQAEEGQPIGAIGALLSVDRLKNDVLPFARGDTVIAVVAEREIIAAQAADLEESDVTGRLAKPVEYAVAGAVGTHVYRDDTGAERLAAFAPVPDAGWAVLVTHPSPMTYGPNRALLERGLVALALAVAATLILAVVLGEWIARPLRSLTAQAAALARGDFSQRPTPTGGGELAALNVAFREMADQLETQVHDLEAAREAGAGQAAQLRELNRRTVRLQEDERRRIAAEIHDAVAPLITGALYQARALRLSGGAGDGAGPESNGNGDPRVAGLDAIGDLLARAMEELHRVIFALRPPDLDDLGVMAAIERYVTQVQRSGLNCRLEVIGRPPTLTPEVRLAIYRIVQEALHNALRHAAADEAIVRLETTDGLLRVTINDNGAGFNLEHATRPTALGLLSMRERAAAIGASFAVASRPGDGTTVVIERRMEAERGDEVTMVTGEATAALPAAVGGAIDG